MSLPASIPLPPLPQNLGQGEPLPPWAAQAWGEATGAWASVQQWWTTLPPSALAWAILAAGGVLVLFGGRIVKPGIVAACVLWGMLLGTVLVPRLIPGGLAGVPGEFVGFAAGGLLGIVAGLMVYRTTLTIAASFAGALAGVLVGAIVLGRGAESIEQVRSDAVEAKAYLAQRREAAATGISDSVMITLTPGGEATRTTVQGLTKADAATRWSREAQRAGQDLGDAIAQRWGSLSDRDKTVFTLAGGLGSLGGALFGLIRPRRVASGVTAAVGAVLVVSASAWLIAQRPELASWTAQMERMSPASWLIAWGALAAFGWSVQAGCAGKPKKPAQAEPSPGQPATTPAV